ncbi:unnamed protein product, partial [Urochloa humidicola]
RINHNGQRARVLAHPVNLKLICNKFIPRFLHVSLRTPFFRFLYAETSPPPFFSFAARCAGDLRCRFPALPSVRAEAARGSGLAVTLLAPLLYFSPASGQPRSFPHRPAWHPGPNPAHLQPWIYRCGGGFHRRRPRQPGDEVALTRRQHFPSRGGVDPDWSGCSLPSIATRKGAKSSRRCDVVRSYPELMDVLATRSGCSCKLMDSNLLHIRNFHSRKS